MSMPDRTMFWSGKLKGLCIKKLTFIERNGRISMFAGMAELADAPDLGSGVNRRAGSSPVARTMQKWRNWQTRTVQVRVRAIS